MKDFRLQCSFFRQARAIPQISENISPEKGISLSDAKPGLYARYFYRMRYLLLLIVLLLPFGGRSQHEEEHRLLQLAAQSASDSARFYIYRDLGYLFEFNDSARAMTYYRTEMELANRCGSPLMRSMAWLDYGSVQYNAGNFPEAIRFYRRSARQAHEAGNFQRQGSAFINLANSFHNLYTPDSAMHYALLGLEANYRAADSASVCVSTISIATFLEEAGRFSEALRYVEEGKAIARDGRLPLQFVNLCITGALLSQDLGDFAGAEKQVREALPFFAQVDNRYYASSLYQNISGIYFDEGRYREADRFADSALHYLDRNDRSNMAAAIRMSKGLALVKTGRSEEGNRYLLEALPIARAEADYKVAREICLSLSETAALDRRWEEAYRYHLEYALFNDSLRQEEAKQRMLEMETRYRNEKLQLEVSNLEQKNQLIATRSAHVRRVYLTTLVSAALVIALFVLLYIIQRRRTELGRQAAILQEEKIRRYEKEREVAVLDSMLKGQESERSRVAKDLHDGVGSMLCGVKLSLSSMQGNMIITGEQARTYARSLEQLDAAIAEMRRVAHNMMPEALLRSGVVHAVNALVRSLNLSGSLEILFEHHHFDRRLSTDFEVILYRLVQELLNNIVKHSGARRAIVQLSMHEQTVNLVVEDDGKGFDPALWEASTGMGFQNLKNRVEYLHGKIHLTTAPGEGSSFLVELPLTDAD